MINERSTSKVSDRSTSRVIKKVLLPLTGVMIGLILNGPTVAAHGNNQTEIPNELKVIFEEVGKTNNICPELLEAMAYRESRFMPDVKSGNCWGMMQVNVKIHEGRIKELGYTEADMLTPRANIEVAADYLGELFETYGDDVPLVLMYYSGSSKKKIENYKENSFIVPYVNDVLTRAAGYERQHHK